MTTDADEVEAALPPEVEDARAVGSRLAALQIRMDTNHAQTTRLLSLVSGLTGQVGTALADATSSADSIGGRMHHLARDAEEMLARLLDATQTTNQAVSEVALRIDRLGGSTAEYSRRLRADVEEYELSTTNAVRSLETVAGAVTTGLVDDVAELLLSVREAVGRTGADFVGMADSGQVRIQRMIDRLDERITDHARMMAAATDQLEIAVQQLTAVQSEATGASEQMADTASNLHSMSIEALDRMASTTGGMEHRVGEMIEEAMRIGSTQTAAEVESLSTTVAWASRSIQQFVETLTDDLASTSTASLRRIEAAGEAARERIERTVSQAQGAITEEVSRSIEPLHAETSRVAEQQAGLAQTVHDTAALFARREDDVRERTAAIERMEQITRDVVALIDDQTSTVRDEQQAALDQADQIASRLESGAERAAAVLDRLDDVTARLDATSAAADRSREELQQVLTRAQEVHQRAEARSRTAAAVPPPV